MAQFINYDQILDDLVTLIQANVAGLNFVGKDIQDIDYNKGNVPFCDVSLLSINPAIRAGQDYYTEIVIQLIIYNTDLHSRSQAAMIRNNLVSEVQDTIRRNPRFSSNIESTILGVVDLAIGESEEQGWTAAAANMQISVFVFTDVQ